MIKSSDLNFIYSNMSKYANIPMLCEVHLKLVNELHVPQKDIHWGNCGI